MPSVRELQRSITSTEFMEWRAYFDREINDFHREDHYAARIVAAVFQAQSKNPNNIDYQDFLIKFEKKTVPQPTAADAVHTSEATWLGILGINPEDPGG